MKLKELMLKNEINFSLSATKEKEAIYFKQNNEDMRPAYFRDIDRIIHSVSYTKYLDKTQVFSLIDNDIITKRIVHVSLVSKLARTIGRALSLNEDLIEAIALGHDLGHVPFGHTGEAILNELSIKYDNTFFNHNVQSVRLLMDIENNGIGLNLTLQTLDGILCHNGELVNDKYEPVLKTKENFLEQYNNCYINKLEKLIPMTLEGCVVRISDIIAYVGRDIEDAIKLGILKKEDIPASIVNVLGDNNKDIVNTILLDVINNSIDKNYIKISDKVFKALIKLKKFNQINIYKKANSKEQIEIYKSMFNSLFTTYLKQLENKSQNSDIYILYLNNMSDEYLKNSNVRIVIDYIAGMTDDFFVKQYNKYRI